MIEIDESHFGYWPNEQHTWLFIPDMAGCHSVVLEQLYAQMMGWA